MHLFQFFNILFARNVRRVHVLSVSSRRILTTNARNIHHHKIILYSFHVDGRDKCIYYSPLSHILTPGITIACIIRRCSFTVMTPRSHRLLRICIFGVCLRCVSLRLARVSFAIVRKTIHIIQRPHPCSASTRAYHLPTKTTLHADSVVDVVRQVLVENY